MVLCSLYDPTIFSKEEWKRTSRLDLREERIWAHAAWRLSSSHLFVTFVGIIFACAAFYAATCDIPIPMDNYPEPFFLWKRSQYTNKTLTLREATESQQPGHPLKEIYPRIVVRIDYGSTFLNYCYLRVVPPDVLISFLRVFELNIIPQLLLRISLLLTFAAKGFLCFFRSKRIITMYKPGFIIQILCYMAPLFDLAQSTFALLLLCFQQWQDARLNEKVLFLMHHNILIFSGLFILHAVVYSFLEVYDRSKKISSGRLHIRIVLIIVYASVILTVRKEFRPYLEIEKKYCDPYVVSGAAIMEYIAMASLAIFSFTQLCDFDGLHFILSCNTSETTLPPRRHDYHPAFLTEQFNSAPFASLRPLMKNNEETDGDSIQSKKYLSDTSSMESDE